MEKHEMLEVVAGEPRPALDAVRAFIDRYVDLSPGDLDLAARYVVFTYRFERAAYVPTLYVIGGVMSGKTRFLQVVGSLCRRPLFLNSVVPVRAMVRALDAASGTLVLDAGNLNADQPALGMLPHVGKSRFHSVLGGPKIVARRGTQRDSLVVDLKKQIYYWHSQGESGDVIEWVMRRRGFDFKTAVEDLAHRAGMQPPEWRAVPLFSPGSLVIHIAPSNERPYCLPDDFESEARDVRAAMREGGVENCEDAFDFDVMRPFSQLMEN